MSTELTKDEAIINLSTVYASIYGTDLRISPIVGTSYLGLDTRNGDFDVVGIAEGNSFKDAINITIQRLLVRLYTPLSEDTDNGSDFILFATIPNMPSTDKVKLLKAEILLATTAIPQIASVVSILDSVDSSNGVIKLALNFTLVTGEKAEMTLVEAL